MPTSVSDILNFVEDTLGDLLIVASILFFFIGILFMTSFYQWVSVFALFFGVILLVSGLAIRLEGPLTLTMPSRGGFGTILVCISLVIIASAGILTLFTTLGDWHPFTRIEHSVITKGIRFDILQPFAWLAKPLAAIGLCLLIVGALLKLSDIL